MTVGLANGTRVQIANFPHIQEDLRNRRALYLRRIEYTSFCVVLLLEERVLAPYAEKVFHKYRHILNKQEIVLKYGDIERLGIR